MMMATHASFGDQLPFQVEGAVLRPVRAAISALVDCSPPSLPERLSGIHNPWGLAATLTNAWTFLDLCENAMIVDHIAALVGPDVILWDSELHLRGVSYRQFTAAGREGRYWPVTPLAGAVALVYFSRSTIIKFVDVRAFPKDGFVPSQRDNEPLYVIRYMAASSRFIRDPKLPANWIAMEEQPLINYTTRPLWLVRGEDRAGNDFVTGFVSTAPRWAAR
jgi:hypothetical protein